MTAAADRAGERYWQIPLIDEYGPRWTAGTATSRTRARRGIARQERPVPARVRDRAVGPPRHRRDRPTSARRRRSRRAARPGSRTRRSSSWPRRGAGRLDRSAPTRRPLAARPRRPPMEPLGPGCSGPRGCALGFVPTGSRPAGPSTTRSTRRAGGRLADGRVCARRGAFALGLLPARFGGDPLAVAIFGAWFVTLVSGWRPTSTSGCCPTS